MNGYPGVLMNQNPDPHSVRRIVLPSGRAIEVVRYREQRETPNRALHVCPECESELVQPVSWSETDTGDWEIALRCPNCCWQTEATYSHDQVESFEEKLEEGLSAILRDLQRLTHANMADQADRFVAALNSDQILPEDF
jgi:hypothetical protein